MKHPPLTVMVRKLGCRHSNGRSIPSRSRRSSASSYDNPSRRSADEKGDLMVLAPSKDEEDVQWLTCQIEARNDSFQEYENDGKYNFGGCTTVCCLCEGPDAWEWARPIGNLPEKPWHRYGELVASTIPFVTNRHFPRPIHTSPVGTSIVAETICVPGRGQS